MKTRRFLALMLVLSILFTFPVKTISETQEYEESNNTLLTDDKIKKGTEERQLPQTLGAASATAYEINSPSDISYGARVTYEILEEGLTGFTEADTQAAVVRFTLENPDDREVTFNYTLVSGSAETRLHLPEELSDTVSISKENPQEVITIDIKPFADKPADYNQPNEPNTFWTGDHFFFLYCSDIQNGLFDGERESLTVPVPVKSEFDLAEAYENAVTTKLIDIDTVDGGTNGIFMVPESGEIVLSAKISGDVRKMIDAGVFTYINIPDGYFINNSNENRTVVYRIGAKKDSSFFEGKANFINLEPNSQTSFYSYDFSKNMPINEVHLGPYWEGNSLFDNLEFIFDFTSTTPDSITICFKDENGQYLRNQVSFFDEASPQVMGVSVGMSNVNYGDLVPVTIHFSEPVLTDDITFKVDDQTLYPIESEGTISQVVSFLYPIGDEAVNKEYIFIEVTDVTGVVDLSGKAQESPGSGSVSVAISFDPRLTFAYCAEPEVNLYQGTSRNMSATITIPLKNDTDLSNWLLNESRISGDVSTAVKAKAITSEGVQEIPLTVQTDGLRVTGLTGSFTAPENTAGEDVYYALEIYMDTGSGYELIDSLVSVYAVQPLILVEEDDITLDYTYWPSGDKIFVNAGASLSLGYHINVDATWTESEYYSWSSSDESIANIDNQGNILLTGTGDVFFTLTVTNPLTDDEINFISRTLTVLETQETFLYVPNGIKNQDLLIETDAKISFVSNLPQMNELYMGTGTETEYTFTLYELEDGITKKEPPVSNEVIKATAQEPLNSYTVRSSLLTKVTAKNQYGYLLEISASDMLSDTTLTASANIRMRSLPAKATLIRPESVFMIDNAGSFPVGFDIENKYSETQYALTVTRNSESTPVATLNSPEIIRSLTVNITEVNESRLMDVYTVDLKAKNPSDEAWSYDSYCVYVYNASAMKILVDGFPVDAGIFMGYDFEDGEVMRTINFLQNRSMFGKELIKTVKIDDKSYAWSSIADRVTWKVEGESVSLWHDGKRINDEYNPVLLPGTPIVLIGDGSGSSVVTATHTLTGMTRSMTAITKPLNDKLYFFRVYPNVPCNLVYTNGWGETKTVAFEGEVGVYEETGIKSSVYIYPTGDAENVYSNGYIFYTDLLANQNSASAFNLYPVNTVKLPKRSYGVIFKLYDEVSGALYNRDIVLRGGVYLNGQYQEKAKLNGEMGNVDQILKVSPQGEYGISIDPSDFTDRLEPSDELSYVFEINFADNSHYPLYIKVDNAAIQAGRSSPGASVHLQERIKPLDASSIQNNAVVISQTITIDGEEKSITDRIVTTQKPESAVLDMVVMMPKFIEKDYRLLMLDSTGYYANVFSKGELMHAYPFSDTVTLHFSCDIREITSYSSGGRYWPGQVHRFYPLISDFYSREQIKLSRFIEVQDLTRVRNMQDCLLNSGYEEGDLTKLYTSLWDLTLNAGKVGFNEDKDAVKDALRIMSGHMLDTSTLGLELQATDDPLVYKGIIRFAVGSYSKDNPSGLFVASDEKSSFNFLPGFSDVKAMAKGEYLKKAKEEMNRSSGKYKRYGGGAYIECLVYFDASIQRWKLSLMYGDFYLGAGGTYYYDYNGWVSFVPVTATFEYNMTAEVGLTILNSQIKKETAYIPRLRPVFSIYGFGGVGFEYRFASFKAGGYGFVEHEQNHLWYTDSNGLRMDGQQLKIKGEVGVEFKIKIGFISDSKKYVLADYTKSWNYNEYDKIQQKIAENKKEREKGFLAFPDGSEYEYAVLVPVEENIAFEDRSYLNTYERSWGSTGAGRRMFALMSSEDLKTIWTNAYPDAMPQLSDDGEIMVYLSDTGTTDITDTAILFALKDGEGNFSEEGSEINKSDYPDSTPVLSGTKDGASAAWVRIFTDISGEAGSAATIEDAINGLVASEIMAGIYNGEEFTTTQLTDNDNPDLAPVTAASDGRAITAWRSVTLGSMDNPLDFTSDYIMYSVYNGSSWSAAKYLYDGSINKVQSVNTAMLPDGTSAIVYQMEEKDGDSEIFCAVLDAEGNVIRITRLTDNDIQDTNPQITTAQFPDGDRRFVIGWNAQTEIGENTLQMQAVNSDGTIYPEFSLVLSDSKGESGYFNFRFTKGADKIDDLSVVWVEPDNQDNDMLNEYKIFGTKLHITDDNRVLATGKQKLLELDEGITLDSLDSRVDPETGVIEFVMLNTETSADTDTGIVTSGQSKLMSATGEYKNSIIVTEPFYSYEDLLPGYEMPVKFTVKNDGIKTISKLTIVLGEISDVFEDQDLAPGEEREYTISFDLDDPIENEDYTITAQFADSEDTFEYTGTLRLDVPDVGIHQIDKTKETQRERGFHVLLENTAFSDLKEGTHTVTLEVWDQTEFMTGSPIKTITISEDDFDILNDSLLSVDFILTEEDLQSLLNDEGEIPEGGAWLLFRTVLTEGEDVIEDADISNDIGFERVKSLIEKNGTSVSLASIAEVVEGKTIVQIEAINNSMQAIDNGNIIATLRDERGNVLETKQTYASTDSSLLDIPGEESATAEIEFNRTGYTADITFARVSGESTLLSALNLTGVPISFDSHVLEYDVQAYDLSVTNITAVAENPASVISVTKNGKQVSISSPVPLSYGTTVFNITVTTGETNETYTVTVNNIRPDSSGNPHNSGSKNPVDYKAGLTIGGVKFDDLTISLKGSSAVVTLGSSAQDIFSGNTEATLELPKISNADKYTLDLPANVLAGSNTGAALTVSTDLGSVRIPAGMLAGMPDLDGKTAGINIGSTDKSKLPEDIRKAIGDRPVLSLTLTLDDKQVEWHNPDAPVTVRIPYIPTNNELDNPESIVIWYIDGNGKAVSIPNGRYDPVTGTVTFMTTHFSDYAVVYNHVSFKDVPPNAWYSQPVSFIAAREITAGTGSGRFSPEATLTRGEFIVLLMRAYGISPDENAIDNFSDAGNGYFAGYLAAAKRLRISAGVGNNMFGSNNEITRQEMFTMLYNALKAIGQLPQGGSEGILSDFSDAGQIAPWAMDAMSALVKNGIIAGNGKELTPHGKATRAQMAQMLYTLFNR